MKLLKIDKKFNSIIPPLTDKEYKQLEELIIEEGCRDAIVIWNDIILDGHNRYKICNEHNIKYKTISKDFDSRHEATIWIINNQLGRRNLTSFQRFELVSVLDEMLTEKAKENQKLSKGAGQKGFTILKNLNVTKEMSEKAEMGEVTYSKAKQIKKSATKNQKEKLRCGEETINAVYKEIKKEEKNKKAKKKRKIILLEESEYKPITHVGKFQDVCKNFEDKSIDHIITDPPYPQEYLDEWRDLAVNAERILKPSGLLITYSGHNIPEICEILSTHLLYYHMFILLHAGNLAALHKERVNCAYKPIWVFQKAPFKSTGNYIKNVITGTGREKDSHEWQQAVDELTPLIENFTEINDVILDPFAGSGTTGIACKNNNRRSILIDKNEI